ncbi:MAG: protein jag [Eubacteriales bacterium]|nr:protein jag [Eubacteriales bacterium]
MDVTEKWGDDVDQAVELALKDLKCSRDEVDVTILEQPTRGFLGIGSKLARVRVEKKSHKSGDDEEEAAPAIEDDSEETEVTEDTDYSEQNDEAESEKVFYDENHEAIDSDYYKNRPRHEFKKKPLSELEDLDVLTPNVTVDNLDFNQRMNELPECDSHPALDFLEGLCDEMGLDVDMTARADEENVYIEITGEDCGTIIGRRGQTLDAIQYLTSLVVNKKHNDYIKVVIDVENYRERREKTLEQLAEKMARKAVKSGHSLKLDPMNPYERKVIHSTLQNDRFVTTRSEGQDPYRRVIIELKR